MFVSICWFDVKDVTEKPTGCGCGRNQDNKKDHSQEAAATSRIITDYILTTFRIYIYIYLVTAAVSFPISFPISFKSSNL